jgi:hypothetical protein
MLRLSCCYALESGITIATTMHDAVLIQAALKDLPDAIVTMQRCMARASQKILNGFTLTTDVKAYPHPQHFVDPRGNTMWRMLKSKFGLDPFAQELARA